MSEQRAFVAGATGYTGRAVVRVLRERGVQVTAHVRPDSPRLEEWRARFGALGAMVDATSWDESAMREAIARVRPTHVFSLLGTTRRRIRAAGAAASYESVDYGFTALLVRATKAAAPTARFIYLSSLGASETGTAYMRARGRAERELRESGLSWITARPAFVTGEDREEPRPAERIAGTAVDAFLGAIAFLGIRGPQRKYASLTGEALARALATLALSGRDGVYHAAALRAAASRHERCNDGEMTVD